MPSLKLRPFGIAAAALAAASIALPAFAQQELAPLNISPKAPTTLTIPIQGKTPGVIYLEVRKASYVVCGNAVGNHELSLSDFGFCTDGASTKAMRQFATIERAKALTGTAVIVLATR